MDVVLTIFVKLLEGMFLFGLLGSAVVILWSGVEDIECIFEEETHPGQLGQDSPTIAVDRTPA